MLEFAIALIVATAQAQSAPANPLPDVAAKLAAVGVNVDAKKVGYDANAAFETAVPTLVDYNVRLYGSSWFDAFWLALRACGRPVADDVVTFRTQTAREMLTPQAAWYHDESKRILANSAVLAQGGDIEALLAHEMTHAAQDQREGVTAIFRRLGKTFDGWIIARCLTEGEADAASQAVVLAREKKTLKDLDRADYALRPGEITQGGVLYHYGLGRERAIDRFRAGGWKAVLDAYAKPPTSSEQLAHPSKLGKDAPVDVALPDWPAAPGKATLVRDDTWGELGMHMFLVIAGVPGGDAYLASVGWDGDRLRVWKRDDGAWALAWRSAWDREDDAKQFEAALAKAHAKGAVTRRDRVVDWVFADKDDIAAAIVSALAKAPLPAAAPAADGVSTAEIEAEWTRRQPHVEGGRWIVPELGLSVAAPDGWESSSALGSGALLAPLNDAAVATGFRDNFFVSRFPLPQGATIDTELEQTRITLGRAPMKLVSAERGMVDGRDALILEYTSRQQGRRLHHFEIQFVGAAEKVSVTATVLESRWSDVGPVLEKALREMKAGAPSGNR